jgi:hypothetical protein
MTEFMPTDLIPYKKQSKNKMLVMDGRKTKNGFFNSRYIWNESCRQN